MAVEKMADQIEQPQTPVFKGRHRQYYEGKARREAFIAALREEPNVGLKVICAHVGIKYGTYEQWRTRYPEFKFDCDSIRANNIDEVAAASPKWKAGFGPFRKHFFGMDSPWFHLEVVDALENSAPGSVTLILLPPEHGKTTLLEDWCNMKLANEPHYRIGYGSENIKHATKVLGRVKGRMDTWGAAHEYVVRFGPFMPEDSKSNQPWAANYFNVRKKGHHDERDYSMVALGIGSAVAGSRFDLLIIDDVQSLKSINKTDVIFDTIRQDWFSRPGPKGRTVIVGTRVGEDDVYFRLMDEIDEETGRPLVDRVIMHPALRHDLDTKQPIYLWPDRYTPEEYDIMRRKAGPVAWSRNYQQQPVIKGMVTFNEDVLENALNRYHAYLDPIPNDVRELAITVDPALGGQNAITIQGWAPDRMVMLDTQGDWGLSSTEQVLSLMSEMLARWVARARVDGIRLRFTHCVIEEAAYQKSLVNDERLKQLQEQYGFATIPHQTGANKNDPDLGISGMVFGMYSKQICFPAATDEFTRDRIEPCVKEFTAWRPNKRGTKLKQDRVMATWFGWLIWRNRRHTLVEAGSGEQDTSAFKTAGLPWTPMQRIPVIVNSSPLRAGSPLGKSGPRRKARR